MEKIFFQSNGLKICGILEEPNQEKEQVVIIAQGDNDYMVLIDDSRKLVKELPNGKLIEIPGADHFFTNDGEN